MYAIRLPWLKFSSLAILELDINSPANSMYMTTMEHLALISISTKRRSVFQVDLVLLFATNTFYYSFRMLLTSTSTCVSTRSLSFRQLLEWSGCRISNNGGVVHRTPQPRLPQSSRRVCEASAPPRGCSVRGRCRIEGRDGRAFMPKRWNGLCVEAFVQISNHIAVPMRVFSIVFNDLRFQRKAVV